MILHPHTQLMNYVIGLCKGNKNWISILRDLQYDVEIIEQNIRTSKGNLVKPDIIKISKKHNHALVIDCKSGTNNEEQMSRYSELKNEDLLRWVDTTSKEQLTFDVCIVDFSDNHAKVAQTTQFPIITFYDTEIKKTNDFSLKTLNDSFANPIDLKNKIPPLDYYPFSDFDHDSIIIPRILRTMVSLAMKKSRGGPDALDSASFQSEEILEKIHPLWKTLSQQHQNSLKTRIQQLVNKLIQSNRELSEKLQHMQQGTFKVRGPATSFTKICDTIIETSKVQTTFDQKFV